MATHPYVGELYPDRVGGEEILKLLGASVVGFPGDAPPGPADAEAPLVAPQSVQMARLVAASLRLTQTRVTERRPNGYPVKEGPVAERDLDAVIVRGGAGPKRGESVTVVPRCVIFWAPSRWRTRSSRTRPEAGSD